MPQWFKKEKVLHKAAKEQWARRAKSNQSRAAAY